MANAIPIERMVVAASPDHFHRLIAHLKIPRSQFYDGKWTSGNGDSRREGFFMILAVKLTKGMTQILFETGMPFVYVVFCEAAPVSLSRPHHRSSVCSVPQVFFINLNLRTVTVSRKNYGCSP